MVEDSLLFVIDETFSITGKGTVLSGELKCDISIGDNILIVSVDGSLDSTCSILGIDAFRNGEREEAKNASAGESVGIWVDISKEKLSRGMGVFLENPGVTEAPIDEIIEFLNEITQKTVKVKSKEINSQLEKYLVSLKKKEKELIYVDDYDDLCFDQWWDECHRFIENKLMRQKLMIIDECRLLLRENYKQKLSFEILETCDEYIDSRVVDCLTEHIDNLLEIEGN